MNITKKNMINLAFYYLMVFVVASGIVEHQFIWHLGIVFIFIMVYFAFGTKRIKDKRLAIIIGITFSLFLASVFISDNWRALSYNIRSPLYSLCAVGLLYLITKKDGDYIYNKLVNQLVLHNFILIINTIVLAIQSQRTGFLIKKAWLIENPFYEDHCAGLFGFNATNIIGLYAIFVMMLNLTYAKSENNKKKRTILYGITIITQTAMAILSQFNDNVAYYILIIVFLLIYFYFNLVGNSDFRRKLNYVFKYVIIIVVGLLIAFNLPGVGEYLGDVVRRRIERVLYIGTYKNVYGYGSNERLAILKYAFTLPSTWLFGDGIGRTQFIESGAFGFYHFGINSIGAYIIIGGIWFYLAYTLYKAILRTSKCKKRKKSTCIAYSCVLPCCIFYVLYNHI